MTFKHELGIIVKHDVPMVSSREIAERFGKEHMSLLHDIKNLECDEFTRFNFKKSSYRNSQNKKQTEYFITLEGFNVLAKCFTGEEAEVLKKCLE